MPITPDDQIDDYMARLTAQLKALPATAQEEQLRELRHHLDALIAAHLELGASEEEATHAALRSFGDPVRIGRQMAHEWQRKQHRHGSAELRAVLFALAFYGLMVYITHTGDMFMGRTLTNAQVLVALAGIPLLIGAVTGTLFPRIAVSATLFTTSAVVSMVWLPALMLLTVEPDAGTRYALKVFTVQAACWLPLSCLAAYGASALRRGMFYTVGWNDLKLARR